ncbi:uncharacterized protein BCR38DRAFT_511882 [Pseudomassariella vexata]|uniref:Uncharacterized protein n=1 Tax=Pseudomassariella vexata TaxID=1141098 RepID=A0A1Y2E3P1_9PEZI|nr:uncharacterized protein BCR38DRAFT_511882 [Pseudomassariella vexata]ORY66129.1 hypothetical protein BCR38DRAFT_511882 [Pseudomassariella vexata]
MEQTQQSNPGESTQMGPTQTASSTNAVNKDLPADHTTSNATTASPQPKPNPSKWKRFLLRRGWPVVDDPRPMPTSTLEIEGSKVEQVRNIFGLAKPVDTGLLPVPKPPPGVAPIPYNDFCIQATYNYHRHRLHGLYAGAYKQLLRYEQADIQKFKDNVALVLWDNPALNGPPQVNHETALCPNVQNGVFDMPNVKNKAPRSYLEAITVVPGSEKLVQHVPVDVNSSKCGVCWQCQLEALKAYHQEERKLLYATHCQDIRQVYERCLKSIGRKEKFIWWLPCEDYEFNGDKKKAKEAAKKKNKEEKEQKRLKAGK